MERLAFLKRYATNGEHYNHSDELNHIIKSDISSPYAIADRYFKPTDIVSSDNIDTVMNISNNTSLRGKAIMHPSASPKTLYNALSTGDSYIRMNAADHINADSACIDKALGDKSSFVVERAIKNPNASVEQIKRGLEHPDFNVKKAAEDRLSQMTPAK